MISVGDSLRDHARDCHCSTDIPVNADSPFCLVSTACGCSTIVYLNAKFEQLRCIHLGLHLGSNSACKKETE